MGIRESTFAFFISLKRGEWSGISSSVDMDIAYHALQLFAATAEMPQYQKEKLQKSVDFFTLLLPLMVQKSGGHQLRLVVCPTIYSVFYIPGGAGFLPSTILPSLKLTAKTPKIGRVPERKRSSPKHQFFRGKLAVSFWEGN